MLTHDALASRSPDRIEGNPALADDELVHDLEDAQPAFEPNELADPESVCHVSPRSFPSPQFAKGVPSPSDLDPASER